jgi:hypothetical protein
MKNSATYFTAVLVIMTSLAWAAPKEEVEVINTKSENLFVFKVKSSLKGAEVQIYYSNGDLVSSQLLEKKKMIINFRDVKYGTYIIKVRKGKTMEVFNYIKR